jgi:D-alanine-D-alanine ligase
MNRRAAGLRMACLAERFVDGREFNMAVLEGPDGPVVLPAAEIVFQGYGDKPRVVGYRAKWEEESFEYANTVRAFPGDEDGALKAELSRLTLACFRLFGLSGYARVDFRVAMTTEGAVRPFLIDVNANPCLTPGAGFPETARHAGLAYPEMIGRILAVARA